MNPIGFHVVMLQWCEKSESELYRINDMTPTNVGFGGLAERWMDGSMAGYI